MAEYDIQIGSFESLFSLEGKVAVVTGGSRGLGLSGAAGLLKAGCSKVYITSRKAAACEEACALLNKMEGLRPGAKAISVPADGSKVAEIERLVKEVSKTTDHVDILFANAGATWGAPFDDHDDKAFSKVMDLNVKSVFFCAQKYAWSPSSSSPTSLHAQQLRTNTSVDSHLCSPRAPQKQTPRASSPPPPSQASASAAPARTARPPTLPPKPPSHTSSAIWPSTSARATSSATPLRQASSPPRWPMG